MQDTIQIEENTVYRFHGDIRITGNVGKNAHIIVKEGHLIVEGSIETGARLAAGKTLTVHGNIEDHVRIFSKETLRVTGDIGNHCDIEVSRGGLRLKNIGDHATLKTLDGDIEATHVGESARIKVTLNKGHIRMVTLGHYGVLQTEQGDIDITDIGDHGHLKSLTGDIFVQNSNDSIIIQTTGYVIQDTIKPLGILTTIQQENKTIITNLYMGGGRVIYAGRDISALIENAGETPFYLGNTKITKEIGEVTTLYYECVQNRLPRCWHVPIEPEVFVGRSIPLSKLEEHFSGISDINTEVNPLVCYGLGGVGKTALALKYVYDSFKKKKYKQFFWFSAESKESLRRDYLDLAKKLGYSDSEDEEQVHHVIEWFSRHSGFLLVYDNAARKEIITPYLPYRGHHVLITSPFRIWSPFHRFSLDLFSREDCQDYIGHSLKEKPCTEKDMDDLAEELGQLPRALYQACHYIQYTQEMHIRAYLYRYKNNKALYLKVKTPGEVHHQEFLTSLENPEMLGNYKDRMYFSWDMRHIQLRFLKTSNTLLETFSCMHATKIPFEFCLAWKRKGMELTKTKQIELVEYLDALANYSLIQINCEKGVIASISIHPLLQTVVRLQMTEKVRLERLAECILAIKNYCPQQDRDLAAWERKQQMIPHVKCLYEYGHAYFPTELNALLDGIMGVSSIGQYYKHSLVTQSEKNTIATAVKCLRFSSIFTQKSHLKLPKPILNQILGNAFIPSQL